MASIQIDVRSRSRLALSLCTKHSSDALQSRHEERGLRWHRWDANRLKDTLRHALGGRRGELRGACDRRDTPPPHANASLGL